MKSNAARHKELDAEILELFRQLPEEGKTQILDLIHDRNMEKGEGLEIISAPRTTQQIADDIGIKQTHVKNAFSRVSPEDAYQMMMKDSVNNILSAREYAKYGYQKALEKGLSKVDAEMHAISIIWTAGRALISGRRIKKGKQKNE